MTEALHPCGSVVLTPDAAIRAWGAYELTAIPDRSPRYTLRRVEILEKVLATETTGMADLFTTAPAQVARRMHPGRADSNRTTRAARRVAAALEDFRAWYQVMSNRGEV